MATLSARATPQQKRILRAIAGAVENVAHVHPGWITDPRAAGSIAKRATGTLTAQWAAVLAASGPSNKAVRDTNGRARRRRSDLQVGVVDVSAPKASRAAGLACPGQPPHVLRRDPLRRAHNELGFMAGQAMREGNVERAEALRDALRVIARLRAPA